MTQELEENLTTQINDALTCDDPKCLLKAIAQSMKALMSCQRKTSDRVKEMMVENDRKKEQIKGAKSLLILLKYIAAAGGGAGVLKLITQFS